MWMSLGLVLVLCLRSIAAIEPALDAAVKAELCSENVEANTFCVENSMSDSCQWLREAQRAECGLGETLSGDKQGCTEPATGVTQAEDNNAALVEAFFANQEVIALGTAKPRRKESVAGHTIMPRRKGMILKEWTQSLPNKATETVPFFDDSTAMLFNSMW